MSREPEKKYVFIYLVALIHWVGAGITIGLASRFFNLPAIVVAGLLVLAFFLLPPIVRIVDEKDVNDK